MTVYIVKDDNEWTIKNVVRVSGNDKHLKVVLDNNSQECFELDDVGYFEIK